MTPENELLSMLQTAISSKKSVEDAIRLRSDEICTLLCRREAEAYKNDEKLNTLNSQVGEWDALIKQTSEELFNTGTVVRSERDAVFVVDHTEENPYHGLSLWVLPVTDPATRRKRYDRILLDSAIEIISLNDLIPVLRKNAERLIARLRLKVWRKKSE